MLTSMSHTKSHAGRWPCRCCADAAFTVSRCDRQIVKEVSVQKLQSVEEEGNGSADSRTALSGECRSDQKQTSFWHDRPCVFVHRTGALDVVPYEIQCAHRNFSAISNAGSGNTSQQEQTGGACCLYSIVIGCKKKSVWAWTYTVCIARCAKRISKPVNINENQNFLAFRQLLFS